MTDGGDLYEQNKRKTLMDAGDAGRAAAAAAADVRAVREPVAVPDEGDPAPLSSGAGAVTPEARAALMLAGTVLGALALLIHTVYTETEAQR